MALIGMNTGGGGNFLPILKYDARAGIILRRDRDNGVNKDVAIDNEDFTAVFDLANVEVGWIGFLATGPSYVMVPNGKQIPAQPTEEHKGGFRVRLKLGKTCGGDVREFSSTAYAVKTAMNLLHDAFEKGLAENPGKLPVIGAGKPLRIAGAKGTSYQPSFMIKGWVDRPSDLGAPATAAPASVATPSGPPSTGSKVVTAPGGDDDDFG